MRGTRFFFMMVTALLIIFGVSSAQPCGVALPPPLAAVEPPAPIVAQLVAALIFAPVSLSTLSQYITFVPTSSASRMSFSCVSAADAPISSVAPSITSSYARSSSLSLTLVYVPYWSMLPVIELMPNFCPVGITPSVSFSALAKVFHLRHSTCPLWFAGSDWRFANCA